MSLPRFLSLCVLAGVVGLPSGVATSQTIDPVWTWHNDNGRTGRYLSETALTPTTVTQSNFGLRWQLPVKGQTFAQPLAVPVFRGHP